MRDLAKDYVSVSQAAKMRGVSRQAILKALSRGTLKGTQIDQFWLIHRRDLMAFEPRTDGGVKRKKKRTVRRTRRPRRG
jgi:Helix-turn-helix domain